MTKQTTRRPAPSAQRSALGGALIKQNRMGRLICYLVLAVSLAAAEPAAAAPPVFPGAKGFGTQTVAGSGRHLSPPRTTVYRVTNLNDSGSGSLRACVEASGPRTCVFEISGTIMLDDYLEPTKPYLTIAGQTAPSPGITLRRAGIRVKTHDVLIQHLRIRAGDDSGGPTPSNRDSLTVYGDGSYNVVVDHCTVSWAVDENISVWFGRPHDLTFSNLLISEALNDSIHAKGAHSKAMLVAEKTARISVHNNLFAHHIERHLRLKGGSSIEFVNNVAYNFGGSAGANFVATDSVNSGVPQFINLIGNYYKPGPNTTPGGNVILQISSGTPAMSTSRYYVKGNIGPTRTSDSGDQWSVVSSGVKSINRKSSYAVDPTGIPELSPTEAYKRVLVNAGARPADRDAVDKRVVSEVEKGTGKIINCVSSDGSSRCQKNGGGYPNLAVNKRSLNLPSDLFGDSDGDGYTNLEEFLFTMAASVEGGVSNDPPAAPVITAVEVVD